MKKACLTLAALCAVGLMAGCKGGTTNEAAGDTSFEGVVSVGDTVSQYRETEDVYVDGNQTEYVLIFRSKGCWERMLHDVENDSVALKGFYVAADDLGYYYYENCKRWELNITRPRRTRRCSVKATLLLPSRTVVQVGCSLSGRVADSSF